jgi:hypothetical protein
MTQIWAFVSVLVLVIRNDLDVGVRVSVLALIRNDPDLEARAVASAVVLGNEPNGRSPAMYLARGRSEIAVRQTVSGAVCRGEMRHQ